MFQAGFFLCAAHINFRKRRNFFGRLCTGAYENSGLAHMRISNFYMPYAQFQNKNSKIFPALRAAYE